MEQSDARLEENPFDSGYSILLTSFWGWSPETWGAVTRPQELVRPD